MNRKRDTVTAPKQTQAGSFGFTIVELLIVIVVIGVLAALTYVGYNAVQEQAKRTKVKHDIVQITNAIDTARGKTGKVLYKITGNTVTDYYCATQDTDPALLPKTHRCWTDYYAALNAISQASGVTLQNVVDPWGRPYMIDENEGYNGPCYQDTVAMYPRPFKQQWVPDGSTTGENVPLSGFSGCTEPTPHTPSSPTTPATPTTPAATTITTGLIAWWPFNGNAKDISGNGHDGVIYGGVTGATGQNGTANNAYLFDGSSGYISSNESLMNGTRSYSFGGWVYFTDGQASRAGFAGQNDSVENLWYNGTDSRFYQGGATTSCVYLAKNTWHFIYITYDGTATRQYANGTQCDSSNNSRSDSSYNFNIGGGGISDSAGNYFKGRIDDVRIYNRALSGSEINTLYNNGAY